MAHPRRLRGGGSGIPQTNEPQCVYTLNYIIRVIKSGHVYYIYVSVRSISTYFRANLSSRLQRERIRTYNGVSVRTRVKLKRKIKLYTKKSTRTIIYTTNTARPSGLSALFTIGGVFFFFIFCRSWFTATDVGVSSNAFSSNSWSKVSLAQLLN